MDFNLHFGNENLTIERLHYLIRHSKDYALMNGALLQLKKTPGKSDHVPFMLFPTPFPKKLFDEAKQVQEDLNLLVYKASQDPEFLKDSLKGTVKADEFIGRVYDIYEQTIKEGIAQPIEVGIIRADYMLESNKATVNSVKECNENMSVKQVEINTMAAGAGSTGCQMSKVHRYFAGMLNQDFSVISQKIPNNSAVSGIGDVLAQAWELYGSKSAIILMPTFHEDVAKYDQTLTEYYLHERVPRIKLIRRTYEEVHKTAKLVDKKLFVEGQEVAVVYHRYGIVPGEYKSEDAWSARLLIERSLAIKCPTAAGQLVGTKKIQQVLAKPGVIEKYISDKAAVQRLRSTFTGLYSLDEGPEGDQTVKMAFDDPEKFVLKPQREGGGNNFFGEDIKTMLNKEDRSQYILMDKIRSPSVKNYIVRPENSEHVFTDVVPEISIFGVFIANGDKLIANREVGHTMRTKGSEYDDGSVSSGIANYDSPYLF